MSQTSRALLITDNTQSDNPIVLTNPAFTTLTGYTQDEVIGRNCRFLQGAGTDKNTVQDIQRALAAGQPIRREILNYRKSGEPFWNDLTIDALHDATGALIGFVGVQYNSISTGIARVEQADAEFRLEHIAAHLPGYLFRRVLKADGSLDAPYFGALVRAIMGVGEDVAITAADFYRHVPPPDHDRLMAAIAKSAANMSLFNEEFRLISAAGIFHWFRSTAQPRRMPNGDTVWDGFALEVSAEKAADAQLAYLAFHDSLTGLSNRSRFKNSLHRAIDAVLPDEERIGIFFIDVDQFQNINETFGQALGDNVLRAVGRRLETLADEIGGLVARLGGDEFALLLPAVPFTRPVEVVAESIVQDLAQPMQIDGHEIAIQVCVGAATLPLAPEPAQPIAADIGSGLMKQADLALRAAKQNGPGSFRVYAAKLDGRAHIRMALRQSMRQAIDENQFELHYQPIVSLLTGRIVGAEAHVRWDHPELGLQRPDMFISLAEASGLIVPLGAWIIEEAMRQGQAWRRTGREAPRIAINVSSVQLQKPGFLATVERALARTGADPHEFEFELTEGLLIEASPEMISILNAIKALGFRIAIDDFGAGHSTFRYLRDFPIDKIKIDQTFIRKLVPNSNDAIIVRAMLALAHSLGTDIMAEGIETVAQRDFLLAEGCKVGQGYLFSLPLTATDFGWLLQCRVTLPMSYASSPALPSSS